MQLMVLNKRNLGKSSMLKLIWPLIAKLTPTCGLLTLRRILEFR